MRLVVMEFSFAIKIPISKKIHPYTDRQSQNFPENTLNILQLSCLKLEETGDILECLQKKRGQLKS